MRFTLIAALLLGLGTNAVAARDDHKGHGGRTIHVQAPASISDAIRGASYGDRIIVGPGTYNEQVLVKKSGVQLIGQGAIIEPPEAGTETKNDCTGQAGFTPDTQAGICVAGEGVQLARPGEFTPEHQKVLSVRKPAEGVSITGFNVTGFSGANVFLYGAKNTRVFENELHGGGTYGFLTSGSEHTLIADNLITMPPTAFGFVGICVDDLKTVEVARNTISGPHLVGLCVSTSGALIRNNDVSDCCAGAFVDPGVNGARVLGNKLHNSLKCDDFGSTGIKIDGATNSEVRGNTITEIRNNEDKPVAGVSVVDDPCTGTDAGLACIILGHEAVASNNLIIRNAFYQNDNDVFVNTTGTGNVFKKNKCSSFRPDSLSPNPCQRG